MAVGSFHNELRVVPPRLFRCSHTSLCRRQTREMIEFGLDIPLPDQWSTTYTIQRGNEVWAGPRVGAGGLIEIKCSH